MRILSHLFENNKRWAASIHEKDPTFFERLSQQQNPEYLWIGCSDSRVPANQIVGLLPGDIFVHRNVANLVVYDDLNCQSVLQYGVEALKVRHIIVCGHYGCGGVQAALSPTSLGRLDNWLRYIKDVHSLHRGYLNALQDPVEIHNALCELNIIEQARNVCQNKIVEDAWAREQAIDVHAWIYSIQDGILRDLGFTVTSRSEVQPLYTQAIESFIKKPPHR